MEKTPLARQYLVLKDTHHPSYPNTTTFKTTLTTHLAAQLNLSATHHSGGRQRWRSQGRSTVQNFIFTERALKKPKQSFIVWLPGLTVSINHRLILQRQSKPRSRGPVLLESVLHPSKRPRGERILHEEPLV